jgi:two-component system NtrC family sensor kinase
VGANRDPERFEGREKRRSIERAESRLEARTRELDLIQSLGRRAAEARTPVELFRTVVEELQRGEGLDAALVALRVGGAPELYLHVSRPIGDACAAELVRRAAGLLGWDPDGLPAPRREKLDDFDPQGGTLRSFREEDLVALPVLRRDEAVACLLALPSGEVKEAGLRLLYTTTNQLSLHLDRILAASEAEADRFRSILDSMPQAVVLADRELRVLQLNPAAGRLFDALDTDASRSLWETVERMRGGGSPVAEAEVEAEGRVLVVTVSPLATAGPEGEGVVLVLTDVTERRKMQRQLAQSERMSSLGQMISGVAHELNNPLASILGYAQLLGAAPADERQAKRVAILQEEAGRCRRIVQNLLSFARRQEPERKLLSLNEVVGSVLALMGYQLRVNGITVESDLDRELPPMTGDSHQLQQVLVNLFANALQAIRGAAERGTVQVRTFVTDGGGLGMEVRDSGPGVPDSIRERIFDPFFTTKAEGEGTGLGLSLVYGIVAAHGGSIELLGGEGRGSTFRLVFPTGSPVETTGPSNEEETPPPAIASLKILVVEDEKPLASMIREALEEDGHQVVVVRDGEEALRKVAAESFDAILSDVRMPGMDGERFFQELRARSPELCARLLLTTGDTVSSKTDRFAQRHDLPLLRKPFDVEQLRRAVRNRIAPGEKPR